MKNKTNQKGSITIFVLLACLFFIMFLMGMFMLGAVKRQVQIEATKQTQDIYSQGNANEIYSNYFDDGVVVPIYTKAQLDKMCSGEQISIKEEGGKIYTFSENSIYLLKEDITFEYNGIWQMPELGETGRIEGNGKKITIKDTSKQEETYYYYIGLNNYKEPLPEEDIKEPISLNKSTLDLDITDGVNAQETLIIKNVLLGTVTWTSSNTSVATVSSNGKVTTVGAGETTIIASCGIYSASCNVSVKEISTKVAPDITLTGWGQNGLLSVTATLNNESEVAMPVTYEFWHKVSGTNDSNYVNTNDRTPGPTYYVSEGLTTGYTYTVKVVVTAADGKFTTVEKDIEVSECFVAGTKVLTEEGLKNIEEIKVGEKVYSLNVDNNQRELKEVLNVIVSSADEIYNITVGDTNVKVTPRHKFYVVDKGWIRAYDLIEGDMLVSKDNETLVIKKIEKVIYEERIPVYNLTVEGYHNYLITELEILVHNGGSK